MAGSRAHRGEVHDAPSLSERQIVFHYDERVHLVHQCRLEHWLERSGGPHRETRKPDPHGSGRLLGVFHE